MRVLILEQHPVRSALYRRLVTPSSLGAAEGAEPLWFSEAANGATELFEAAAPHEIDPGGRDLAHARKRARELLQFT